jgi:thymidylate kinase
VQQAPIVAFCGIDGSGKTTAIARITRLPEFQSSLVFKKEHRENVDRLLRFYPDRARDPENYLMGPFAVQQRWAYTLDFLCFYQIQVRPHLDENRILFCDRWTPCIQAWAAMLGEREAEPIRAIAATMPSPDLVIFLRVDPHQAYTRILKSREPTPDEHLRVLEALDKSYLRLFADSEFPVYLIENHDRGETDRLVRAGLRAFFRYRNDSKI